MADARPRLIVDIDGTLCPIKAADQDYAELPVDAAMLAKLAGYRDRGYAIDLFTSRNMRTYGGRIGLINRHTVPALLAWLERRKVPFDELHVGKPWPGPGGFYIDDKAVRPAEFLALEPEQIDRLIGRE